MNNWNQTDRQNDHEKWANWTINPPRNLDTAVKCVTGLMFLVVAGSNLGAIVA